MPLAIRCRNNEPQSQLRLNVVRRIEVPWPRTRTQNTITQSGMKSVPQLIAARRSMREQKQTTTQFRLIVLRRVDCRSPFNAKTKQQQIHHECRSAHRTLFGVRSEGKTNNSRLIVSRRNENCPASERFNESQTQPNNRPTSRSTRAADRACSVFQASWPPPG